MAESLRTWTVEHFLGSNSSLPSDLGKYYLCSFTTCNFQKIEPYEVGLPLI